MRVVLKVSPLLLRFLVFMTALFRPLIKMSKEKEL